MESHAKEIEQEANIIRSTEGKKASGKTKRKTVKTSKKTSESSLQTKAKKVIKRRSLVKEFLTSPPSIDLVSMTRLLPLIFLFLFFGCASLPTHYLSLDNDASANLDEVLKKIGNERLIFVGEVHGTASIHLLELKIIKYLHESGKQVIIALEAFPSHRQETLNQWIGGSLSEYDFERAYEKIWAVPYEYYQGILEYARDQSIPLVAINADNAMIEGVAKHGLHVVSQDFLREIKFTDCSTDAQYEEILGKTYHAAEFPFLCNGQRLRDAIMAYNIAKAMRENIYTVVVLVGVAHALKVAVPRMLQNHADVGYTVLVPEAVKRIIRRPPDKNIADFTWD